RKSCRLEQDCERAGQLLALRRAAAVDAEPRQPPASAAVPAAWLWGAEDCPCPICLDIITDAAYVARCFHRFCSTCIRCWSRQNSTCPLCRQPIERVVRRMPEDHEEHRVGSSARRRRNRVEPVHGFNFITISKSIAALTIY
uniref:RING-type E3 ubiquitin transferase n=1 Tax=Anser brachyrhynchus TaxID=132585 RepID=A0A8B9BLD6_9AVES